jgi:hypothetical protein
MQAVGSPVRPAALLHRINHRQNLGSKMPHKTRQRRWWLQPKADRKVYLIREGQEATSFASLKMGSIKDISIGKEHAKGSKQALILCLMTCCKSWTGI